MSLIQRSFEVMLLFQVCCTLTNRNLSGCYCHSPLFEPII